MSSLVLSKTLETRLNGGYAPPVAVFFSGGINTFTLALRDNPEAAEALPAGAATIKLTMRNIPGNDVETASLGSAIALSGASVSIDVNIPESVPLGYYYLHGVLRNTDNVVMGIYRGYVVVDNGVNPVQSTHLSLATIRSAMSDEMAGENELLEGLEFGTGDFVAAVERSIMTWNNRPPPTCRYSGHNFKYPEMLLNGVCYEALSSLCHQLQRNRMAYQGDGVAVDLEKRCEYYEKRREEYRNLWFNGMTSIKRTEDMMSFTGSVGRRY